jgi:hypothetical protein
MPIPITAPTTAQQQGLQALGGEDEEHQRVRDHHDPGGDRRKRQKAPAHRRHDPLGIGHYADGNGQSAEQEELLGRADGKQAGDTEVGEGGGRDKHAHDVGDVVGAQAVGPEGAGQQQPQARVGIGPQEV